MFFQLLHFVTPCKRNLKKKKQQQILILNQSREKIGKLLLLQEIDI